MELANAEWIRKGNVSRHAQEFKANEIWNSINSLNEWG